MRMTWLSLFLALCLGLSCTAQAAPGSARQAAEQGAQNILSLLNDPAFKNPATHAEMQKKIEDAVLQLFDFEEFSVRTVGPQWKQFSQDQKVRFQAALTELLRNSYIDTLDSYSGEKVVFSDEVSSDNGTRVEIRMNYLAKNKVYPVAFRMLVKNDTWVVYDVIIEGISMIKNYRDQFRDIMAKGDPDALIKRIEAKALEQKNKSALK